VISTVGKSQSFFFLRSPACSSSFTLVLLWRMGQVYSAPSIREDLFPLPIADAVSEGRISFCSLQLSLRALLPMAAVPPSR